METAEISITDAKREARMAEWHNRIVECRTSGKKVSDWCAEHGIGIKTYYYWHRQVWNRESEAIRQISKQEQPQFAEIKVASPNHDDIEIRYDRWEIRLPGDINPELAMAVIRAVSHV